MAAADKLQALLRTCEADEQNAAREYGMLQEVLEERKARLEGVSRERQELADKLEKLEHERKSSGPHSGQAAGVSSITSYTKRLTAQIEKLEDTLQLAREDVTRAQQRCDMAYEELVEARIEKKKIEKLIGSRDQAERNSQQAREEISNDELATGKRRK